MVIMPIYNEFGLIEIDEARIDETCSAYFKWKDLNTYISNNSHRGINMPDAISEPMGCYCLGYLWNRGSEAGDATDPATNRKIEFKATSRFEGDLSSFGPKCTFDDLVFLRFNLEENLLYIYDLKINSEEFGRYPAETFELNFNIKVDCRDIHNVQPEEIPDFDVLLAGFPCQAFSVAVYRQGFYDEKGRGVLFFELVRIIKSKKPEIVFLENVKNLVGHDKGNTFRVIIDELKKENYYIKYSVLNAMEYGNIPQNRERIYITAFKDEEKYRRFDFQMPVKLTAKL